MVISFPYFRYTRWVHYLFKFCIRRNSNAYTKILLAIFSIPNHYQYHWYFTYFYWIQIKFNVGYMRGRVIKSTGSWYQVLNEQHEVVNCRIKGKLRLDGIKHTNPIAVGDWVAYQSDEKTDSHNIFSIEPRKNYIIRTSSNLSKQTHIIASNIDYVMIVCTLALPTTSTGFIDRILVTAEAYHIPSILVFNKTDIYNEQTHSLLTELIELYENEVGYKCLRTSALSGDGIFEMKALLKDNSTLIVGHSGVGKSSLLNAIESKLDLKTGVLSNYHLKGKHTTTFAEMHELSFGGFIVDTPGIREFGIVDIPDADLSHYFKEMKPYIGKCKFNNCIHTNEPGCAIKEALNEGKINESRYHSYLSMLLKEDFYA